MIQLFLLRLVRSFWLVCLLVVSVLLIISAISNLISPVTHDDFVAFASLPVVNIAMIVLGIGSIIFCWRRIVKNW
ncbi:hypothetical protein DCJ43_06860 [Salmonella enterica subsp. enterica serovar Kentucky]|nr:hypothetical protein [Salmonella enterica subsp. enterica serovar Agona]ECD0805273.1 hypothetical protein [Salmonella enterica subsp. enterica serovar Enteritidis]KUX46434.1 hypothetical protein AWF85_25305 [Escherichia coli]MYP68949.1 hypothetical protein [Salmonella enterica subsp. enterica serovar Kentucky]